jgi:hypothetical protein
MQRCARQQGVGRQAEAYLGACDALNERAMMRIFVLELLFCFLSLGKFVTNVSKPGLIR